jgi:hypothetical protein
MKKILLSACALAALTVPASADFVSMSPDLDDAKMFIDVANKNVTTFNGSTLGNGNPFVPTIGITTYGFVDTGSGFSNIKPVNGDTLTSLYFTPLDGFKYDGFFTRGQLEFTGTGTAPAAGTFHLEVNAGLATAKTFDFSTGFQHDFAAVGFDEPNENEALSTQIVSVHMWTDAFFAFKEVKQVMWSPCADGGGCGVVINPTVGGVPEPSTWAMMLLGFVGITVYGARKGYRKEVLA